MKLIYGIAIVILISIIVSQLNKKFSILGYTNMVKQA